MSIASRITSIENHIEEAYTEISRLGVDLTNVDKNIDNIADKLQEAYSQSPKVTDEGSNLSLSPTRKGGLSVTPKGNCEQETIAEVAGTTVEGTTISVNDVDSSKENTIIPKGACEQDSYSGKNILGLSNETKTDVGITATNVDDVITISGTSTSTPRLDFILPQNIIMDGDYNVLVEFEGTKTNVTTFQVLFRKGTTSENLNIYVGRLESTNKVNAIFNNTNDTLTYLRIYFNTGATINGKLKIMLTKSSTLDDNFEKYVGGIPSPNPDYPQDIRVVTGDNSVVVSGANVLNNEMEIGGINNTTGELTPVTNVIRTKNYSIVAPNTQYYISNDKGYANYVYEYDENYNFITSYVGASYYGNYSFTTSATTRYIKVRSISNQVDLTAKYLLNLGSSAITYVDYQGTQLKTLHLGTNYLAGIGTYKDEIVGKTDEWKIVRKVGKYVFNKADITAFLTNLTNTNMVEFRNVTYLNNVLHRDNIEVLCNISKGKNVFSLDEVGTFTYYNVRNNFGGIFIRFLKTDFNTQAELNTYIDNNTINYYFQLYTPTEETITDTRLIESLNNMYQAMGYDGTTNISVEIAQGNAQPYLEYHYNYVTPKPSPDRPSEVKVVTGDNSVVVQNKNLISNIIENSTAGVNGVITSSTTYSRTDYIKIKPSTNYYIQHCVGNALWFPCWWYDKDKNPISNGSIGGREDVSGGVTSPNNANYVIVNINKNVLETNPPMLEYGTTATEYVEHQEQFITLHLGDIELNGIGDYIDEIVGKTDEWKIRRYVGKVVFDGSETWLASSVHTNSYYTRNAIPNKYGFDGMSNLTNVFVNSGSGIDTNDYCIFLEGGNYDTIDFKNKDINSVADLKTFLGTTNLIVYYPLVTPVEIPIIDTQFIESLNDMYDLMGYDGTTNITITSDTSNAQMTASVSALKGE